MQVAQAITAPYKELDDTVQPTESVTCCSTTTTIFTTMVRIRLHISLIAF